MRHEGGDLVRRSMDVAPEEWLDLQVVERVVTEVRRLDSRQWDAGRASMARLVADVGRARATLGDWLRKLLPPGAPSLPWRGSDEGG